MGSIIPYKQGSLWGYQNLQTQQVVIAPQFSFAAPFCEGLARVQQDKLLGFINSSGQFVIEPQYDWALDFKNGKAIVRLTNGKWNLINTQAQLRLPTLYDYIVFYEDSDTLLRDGVIMVQHKGLFGFIDEEGNELISPQYERVNSFQNNKAIVKQNGQWLLIDKAGNTLKKLQEPNLDERSEWIEYGYSNGCTLSAEDLQFNGSS